MPDTPPRDLDDRKFKKLESLIRRSFRVRDTSTPIYVDVAENLDRIGLDQHQIVFGRRGSGKSCLLIFFRREEAGRRNVHTIYILGDTIKTLEYPDVLIRLLLAIFEGLPSRRKWERLKRWARREERKSDAVVTELRQLLTLPSTSTVTVKTAETSSSRGGSHAAIKQGPVEAGLKAESEKRCVSPTKKRSAPSTLAWPITRTSSKPN